MTPSIRLILALFIFLTISPAVLANNYLSIKIEGIEDELLNNVKNSLDIMKENRQTPAKQLTERTIKRSYNLATQQIEQALKPFGYYQPNIQNKLTQKENRWDANFVIDKGPKTIIKELSITIKGKGETNPSTQLLLQQNSIKKGDGLIHSNYTRFKDALYNSLFEAGYIDVKYEKSELAVDVKNNSAYLTLIINSGEQFYFGDIKIEQSVIDEKTLANIITIDRDTPFNTDRLLDLQLKLSDTGFFSNTEINIERTKAVDAHIPVTVIATAAKKLKYSSSVGYGTDTGARLGLSFLNRRVNKLGHRFQSSLQLSQVDNSIASQYIIPIGDINSESIDIFANANQEQLNDIESTQYKVGFNLNENRWGGRTRTSLTLLQEDFSFDDINKQTANLLIPGISYHYKQSDNTFFTREGYSFRIDIHGGIESILSETSFLNTSIKTNAIWPLSSKARLLTRIELGFIQTDEFDQLPPSERFFTGGAQSVRGYDFKDIGTRDSLGNNIGGDRLVASSIEIDHLPWGNFGYAVFIDAGNVTQASSLSLLKTVGLGFRYRSVIGMIRLDFAHPMDDSENDFQFHISIGPDL